MSSSVLFRVLLVSTLVGSACGNDDPIEIPSTQETIGPDGGEVASGSASIVIPAGALDEPTEISIAAAEGTPTIEGYQAVGPSVEILPAGTSFDIAATVTIPYAPSDLPDDTDASQIVIYTSESLEGDFAPLPTTVDIDSSTVSAEVSHLSIFLPIVPVSSTTPGFEPCPTHGECDCSARESRPIEVTGSASLGHFIYGICFTDRGELHVTSYIPADDPDPFADPEAIFDTHLDPITLDVIEELPFDGRLSSPELCQRPRSSYLDGLDGEVRWSVRFVDHDDGSTGDRWYEALLTLEGYGTSLDFSFNGHLNEESLLDTHFIYDNRNSVVGRIRPNGSASFYLHIHSEAHIDVIHIADLDGVLTDPGSHADEFGMGIPTGRTRFELFDDPASVVNSDYAFNSLFLSENPENTVEDLLTVFGTGPSLIRGFVVDGAGSFVERPELGLDSFWSQFGWQNAGMRDGVLHLQSEVASFSNSVLLELNPTTWTVARQWEIGCIGPPQGEGFQLLSDGTLLRFGFDGLVDDLSRVMFIRGGEVIAIGDLPFDLPMQLVHPAQTHVYAADVQTGEVRAIAVP